ncbi:peptidase S8/S53 domain-containing protein [Lactarius quietus]|nr:peptidase S8/S53 domain-containing protein [Lactarius quietus]
MILTAFDHVTQNKSSNPSHVLSVPALSVRRCPKFENAHCSYPLIMRWRRRLSFLSFLAAMPFTNFTMPLVPPWDDVLVKHTWLDVPPNWETLGIPPSNTTIDFHIALVPQHENALIDALYEVSTPGHPKYGAHLTKQRVAQLVAPHPDTLQLIHSWLDHHHIPPSAVSMTHGGGWLTVSGVPVSRANEMLGASYQLFRPSGTNGTTILRTIGYALPAVLHNHIRTVVPTTCFESTLPLWQTSWSRSVGATADIGSSEPGDVLSSRSSDEDEHPLGPSELRTLYRTDTYVPTATDKNELGVSGFANQYPSPADLATFMSICRKDAIDATYIDVPINSGGYDPTQPSDEANQNMQYAQAIAYPTPHTFYSTGGRMTWNSLGDNNPDPDDAFLTWLNHLINLETIPQTISASYVYNGLCDLLAQLGARGVSVLFPSGNEGVGAFISEFPSSCPWVTSVGGTIRPSQDKEVAWKFSGGGFSNHFPRPIYQDPAVPTFLKRLGNQYDGLYNEYGRGIPDLSAQAVDYFVVNRNGYLQVSGTSCATPTVAGIISLLNDYLLSKGKQPLGFLNPWLYGLGVVGMNDIKSGSNPGCGTEGYSAIAGWDPVTGLGTPDFLNLQAIIDYMNQFSSPGRNIRAINESLSDSTNTSLTDSGRQEIDKYLSRQSLDRRNLGIH